MIDACEHKSSNALNNTKIIFIIPLNPVGFYWDSNVKKNINIFIVKTSFILNVQQVIHELKAIVMYPSGTGIPFRIACYFSNQIP